MRIRTDEAGDFNYGSTKRFWLSVVAGIVIPDRSWDGVTAFVEASSARWGMAELKAAKMTADQLLSLARFVAEENLTLAAVATDSRVFGATAQVDFRKRQLEFFETAASRSKRVEKDPELKERVERTRRRMADTRHIKAPGFLQYGVLTPWLLAHLITASLRVYRNLTAEQESWYMDLVLDAQEGADPGKPGDLLRDTIEWILAGDDRTALVMPAEWPSDHLFKVRNADPESGTVTARQVLRGGINPGRSHNDAGLQLADFFAHVMLRLLRDGADPAAEAAWRVLAPKVMPTEDGWPIKVWAYPAPQPGDAARYERLVQIAERG